MVTSTDLFGRRMHKHKISLRNDYPFALHSECVCVCGVCVCVCVCVGGGGHWEISTQLVGMLLPAPPHLSKTPLNPDLWLPEV